MASKRNRTEPNMQRPGRKSITLQDCPFSTQIVLRLLYLIEIEWPEVKDFNDPGEGTGRAVCEEHDLQAAGHERAVEDILFQESLKGLQNTSAS